MNKTEPVQDPHLLPVTQVGRFMLFEIDPGERHQSDPLQIVYARQCLARTQQRVFYLSCAACSLWSSCILGATADAMISW